MPLQMFGLTISGYSNRREGYLNLDMGAARLMRMKHVTQAYRSQCVPRSSQSVHCCLTLCQSAGSGSATCQTWHIVFVRRCSGGQARAELPHTQRQFAPAAAGRTKPGRFARNNAYRFAAGAALLHTYLPARSDASALQKKLHRGETNLRPATLCFSKQCKGILEELPDSGNTGRERR